MFTVKVGSPTKSNRGAPKKYKFPFADMNPGTYFDVPSDHPAATKRRYDKLVNTPVQSAAYSYAAKNKVKFSTKIMEDGSVRIWRIV